MPSPQKCMAINPAGASVSTYATSIGAANVTDSSLPRMSGQKLPVQRQSVQSGEPSASLNEDSKALRAHEVVVSERGMTTGWFDDALHDHLSNVRK